MSFTSQDSGTSIPHQSSGSPQVPNDPLSYTPDFTINESDEFVGSGNMGAAGGAAGGTAVGGGISNTMLPQGIAGAIGTMMMNNVQNGNFDGQEEQLSPYNQPTYSNPNNNKNNNASNNNNTTFFEKLLFCFSINTYKKYFDVDTIDVSDRIVASLTHFNLEGEFRETVLERNGSGPDLYGPFWIATTLIFFVAVSSNLSIYLHTDSESDFEYDVVHIGRAMGIIYSLVFALPIFLFFALGCLSIHIPLIDLICLYGYSLVPFLPASLLCAIPFDIAIWTFLIIATGISLILILRNVVRSIMSNDGSEGSSSMGRKKDGPVFGTIMGFHVIFLFVLKFCFYHHSG